MNAGTGLAQRRIHSFIRDKEVMVATSLLFFALLFMTWWCRTVVRGMTATAKERMPPQVLKPVPEAFALNSPAIDGTGKKHDGRARQYRPHRKQDLEAGPRAAARAERLKAAGSGQARRPPFGKAAKGVMPLPRRQGPG
eukprot:CAMPEP_0177595610 /NCGR_PEP_ID=MMETSP0419_2-20121207/10470_1 /TAXON_ID=582737 /ORGANISM="Tetraselmis sp., Strain GSL018" /LENGTH=138 /DNA_ID=CAMNT_0019087125 /DNA_START=117 /DNA_END=530 /DNA_ORIENTATION=-